jgi:3-methyladenine DNA glycosylase AlkD
MTLQEILEQLESLSDERTHKHNTKSGVGENQYGVKLGDLRKVAKKIKTNHEMALQLWETENFDARMLALLIIKPKSISADELDVMVRSVKYDRVADWLNAYVVKVHPENETLRQKWMTDEHPMVARSAWHLVYLNVAKKPELFDIPDLLDRLDSDMGSAAPQTQWTMNFALAEIGITFPEHRERAIAIGEKFGLYSDYPVVKGCTSPYAPVWIKEMVSRQK